jgi:hypothetical protein
VDNHRFDAITLSLEALWTRRTTILGALAALLAADHLAPGDTEAKKKRKRKKRKKKKQKPQTFADASCPFVAGLGLGGLRRAAQSFIAQRSGKLSRAEFGLRQNVDGATFTVEIRDLNGAGEPDTVLATETVTDIPATAASGPLRTISVNFANPATVTVGLSFALSVTSAEGEGYVLHTNGDINQCPDSTLFSDFAANGDFVALNSGDMVFATFVTA